eukprot:TRINITY_DN3779_c0_g1_i1.p1 TRINITY_DN3779_c0_g1~~TRINITY_DN3779_c0_g1_i1.p1  ORF type:complete len:870 (-),score=247.92 TRINITY_DN3779_c0_g1_i1:71-2680(-)
MSVQQHPLYVGDGVCLTKRPAALGMVLRVAWRAESSDEHWEHFSDLEADSDEEEPLEPDMVEVLWADSQKVSIVNFADLTVTDRGFTHGDLCSPVADVEIAENGDFITKTGTISDVDLDIDVQMLLSGQKLKGIPGKWVKEIHPFMMGRHVVHADPPHLVGTVDEVVYDVEVRFPDRSLCVIHEATPKTLKIVEDNLSDSDEEPVERNCLYYPSQEVTANAKTLEKAEWKQKPKANKNRKKKKASKRMTGTVVSVKPSSVGVYWIKQKERSKHDKFDDMDPSKLSVLSRFKYTKYEIGDLIVVPPAVRRKFGGGGGGGGKGKKGKKGKKKAPPPPTEEEEDPFKALENADAALIEEIEDELSNFVGGEKDVAIVCGSSTKVKVRWDDNVTTDWTPSSSFIPRHALLDCEFLPGSFVTQNTATEPAPVAEASRSTEAGDVMQISSSDALVVVKDVNYTDNTVVVIKTSADGETTEEEISMYSLIEPSDKRFRLGGVVRKVDTSAATSETAKKLVGEIVAITESGLSIAWGDETESVEVVGDLLAVLTDEEDERPTSSDEEEVAEGETNLPPSLALMQLEDEVRQGAEESRLEGDEVLFTGHHSFSVKSNKPSDHRYANAKSFGEKMTSKTSRAIMFEWKKFNDLPDGIHVIAYENHLNLIRGLIVGSEGTVYNHSFFFFDIAFPADYPLTPPKVYYHSYNNNLNPNLKVDGMVCLSLLGTWSGDGVERWDSKRSSVLQVLSSLQGLVLGAREPYFLEAGHDKFRGTKQGMHSSRIYQEKAVFQSLKHYLAIYNRPPAEFAPLITHYIRESIASCVTLAQECTNCLSTPGTPPDPELLAKFGISHIPSKGFLLSISAFLESFQAAKTSLAE